MCAFMDGGARVCVRGNVGTRDSARCPRAGRLARLCDSGACAWRERAGSKAQSPETCAHSMYAGFLRAGGVVKMCERVVVVVGGRTRRNRPEKEEERGDCYLKLKSGTRCPGDAMGAARRCPTGAAMGAAQRRDAAPVPGGRPLTQAVLGSKSKSRCAAPAAAWAKISRCSR